MKFSYVNQPSNPYDYHVARADVLQASDHIRIVAYGDTQSAAENELLDSLDPSLSIIELSSV